VGTALTIQTSLGFLLTLFTSWDYAFLVLALGPYSASGACCGCADCPKPCTLP
jgi:hypothetical protein